MYLIHSSPLGLKNRKLMYKQLLKSWLYKFKTNLSWDCHLNHFTQTFCVQLVESVISSIQNHNISKFTQLLTIIVMITLHSLKQKLKPKKTNINTYTI